MKRKTISVVMTTYNGSKYLMEQLESLARQTLPPDEIIISDDGSSDDTLNIIDFFRQKYNMKLDVIERRNRLGFRENFLATAKMATGDFIAFCDQDDIWREDKIERCSKYFNDKNISMIVHSATTIDQSSKEIGKFAQGITETRIVEPLSYDPWGAFWGFSIVFRRDLLNLHPAEDRFLDYISPNHCIAHDRWIVFLGQIVGNTVEINEPLVAYRQHDNNAFGRGKSSRFSTTDNIKLRSATYIESTKKMTAIARNIKDSSTEYFPLYNKQNSINFFDRALAHLQARNAIYLKKTRAEAFIYAWIFLAKGRYAAINGKGTRWGSFARDLQFVFMRS